MNHERADDGEHRYQELVSLLRSDFTPPAEPEPSSDSALAGLLANVVSTDEIDERFAAPENVAIGERVAELVREAAVTNSFKSFIANEVRQAQAWRRPVDPALSPSALGLDRGGGIFDPVQAETIEGRVLRGFLFDLIHRHTLALETETETDSPPLLLRPDIRPSDFDRAVEHLLSWQQDYTTTYRSDPFAGQSREDYEAAAQKVIVPPDPDLEAWVERLKHLRDNTSPN